jgi:hypothetical protein
VPKPVNLPFARYPLQFSTRAYVLCAAMIVRLILFLGLFALPCSLLAQAHAEAAFDSSVVETGEAFQLHLTVAGRLPAPPEGVDFSPWAQFLPDSNILNRSGWRQSGNNNGIWQTDITFITFDSADLELPPLSVRLRDGSTVATNGLHLEVLPTPHPKDLADMADIKTIRKEPTWWSDYLWALWIVGGVLVLALVLWWVFFRKKAPAAQSRTVQLSPRERALRQLQLLEKQQLWQKGEVKNYYDQLTHILRSYFEEQLRVPALESTSDELLNALGRTEYLSTGQLHTLATLLQRADLAKFAKGQPPAEYHPQALAEVQQLVESGMRN